MQIASPQSGQGTDSHDSQSHTLQLFTLLTTLRPHWPGSLILSCGLSPAGSDLALAANIAGAACLSIDQSPETCRAALRYGLVDFVVNTLDEALRALKNEIRKGHPLSVALQGHPATVLAEALDRGVLPQLFTAFTYPSGGDTEPPERSVDTQPAQAFHAMGSLIVDFDGTLHSVPSALEAAKFLQIFNTEHDLAMEEFSFDSAGALRNFDAQVLEVIRSGDPRRRWATAAPRQFGRSRSTGTRSHRRVLSLTPLEHGQLTRALHLTP